MKKKSLSVKKITHKKNLFKLDDKKIISIYSRFKNNFKEIPINSKLSAAVSGGPDSMALAYLLKIYSLEKNIKINYFHVDHGLRSSSNIEAIKVKKKLKLFNINLKILKWKGTKPLSNIQSLSRKARYELLFNQLNKKYLNTIFLGHTEDDLIENFLIRLSRGSGLNGFVSFNTNLIKKNNILICRPFLNSSKPDLEYISNKIFNFYIEDPSNLDVKYKRARIRKIIDLLKKEKFNFKKIKLTIENLSLANHAIEFYVKKNLNENTIYLKKKLVLINHDFFQQPDEIVFRCLSKLLIEIGGKYYFTRGKKISRLIQRIKSENFTKITLSGCIVEKTNKMTLIYPEFKKKT